MKSLKEWYLHFVMPKYILMQVVKGTKYYKINEIELTTNRNKAQRFNPKPILKFESWTIEEY